MARGEPIHTGRALVPGLTRTQDTVDVPTVEMGGDRARAMLPVIGHHVVTDPAPEGGGPRQNAETLDPTLDLGWTGPLTVSLSESPSLRRITDTPAEYQQVRGGGYSAGGGAEPLSSAVDCALRPAGGLRSAYCGYRLVVASAAPIPIKAPPAVRLKVRPCRPSQGAIRPARPASTSS